jgi:DNA mismatch repair protein MutL
MPIRILPPAVAAGIAAGEMIERPASVVKELVENSLDAGATTITVEIQQGGLQSIRVRDDGCGIPDDEVLLAFERHATSKLCSLEDLSEISTLGFRGEALSSIAAAAHVLLTTRTIDSETASVVEAYEAMTTRRPREAAMAGTSIVVEALFSTIPARLKFIRSSGAESARIRQVIEHMAMANTHVRFSFKSDSRTMIQTTGNGQLRDVLGIVYGNEIAAEMLEVTASLRAPFSVHGMIGPPDRSRPNRTGISLFVNGRWIQSQTISTAVREAYRGLLMEGRYPMGALFLNVPMHAVDVNVHPNKREVRFTHDGDAFASVERAVRDALLEAHPEVQARGLFSTSTHDRQPSATPSGFDFTMPTRSGAWAPLPEPASPGATVRSLDDPSTEVSSNSQTDDLEGIIENRTDWVMGDLRVLGQISKTYIVAEGKDGMHLIDQHSAHESVLYYRLLQQWEEKTPDIQPMLDPLPVELSLEQLETLPLAQEMLARYGVTLELFGDMTYLLRSVPAMARRVDGARLVTDVLDVVCGAGLITPDVHHAVAASIACHSAVRAGQVLEHQEMVALSTALMTESNPQHCPHGRPTTVKVTIHMLEREFGRA